MNEKSILIATATPNIDEVEAMQYYAENSKKLLLEAGGKPIGQYKLMEVIHGENPPALFLVIEFPNDDAIKQYLNSEEYKKLIPYREKAFSKMDIYIAK